MIKVENLTKVYGGETVLNIPALTITKGESFGLVGNNGAGKTTFFRLILDLIRANSGTVLSKDIASASSEHWKDYTGSYLDEGFLIDYLTPEEYFQFVGKINQLAQQEIDEFMISFSDFFNNEILGKKKYIRDLSKGNQKKIGISAAIMTKPEILILDEPFSSLDPTTQFRLKKLLKELQVETQMTMLISSHDLNHVTEVCKRIVVLHNGDIVHDLATSKDTLADLEAYFAVQ
ncbi:MAG: ABC transporter ATP-binding protein [Bacteroidales bacterium]|jgi:ABC-2 type transport system ATP-binding protein|nr:ABC transporter ATP-binding protein [Bacteroidales bacterium]